MVLVSGWCLKTEFSQGLVRLKSDALVCPVIIAIYCCSPTTEIQLPEGASYNTGDYLCV